MKIKNPHILISIFSALLFIPFLGNVHLFDWDEINFAEAAREMIVTNNYKHISINFEPFWEKPPLFFWLQVLSIKIFGVNEFAARLPNAVCGIFTLNIIYFYAKKLFDKKLALWWVLLFAGSFTPHFYFKSGIIDPWFNLFIFMAIVQLYFTSSKNEKRYKNFLYCGLFLGLALLTKGPVAIIICALCAFVFWVSNRFKAFFNVSDIIILVASTTVLPLLWFLPDWLNKDFWFTLEFLKYQLDLFVNPVASHGQPWFYHPLVLIFGCFPAVIISTPYLLKRNENNKFLLFMQILFWVTLILFSSVTTKIVHYSSLCYLPSTFIGAYFLSKKTILYKWQNIAILVIGIIFSLAFFFIALTGISSHFRTFITKYINDDFAIANILTPTAWRGYELIFSIIFLIFILSGFIINLKYKNVIGVKIWLISNTAFMFFLLFSFLPKIENHIQGSIIKYYKTLKNKDAYIETVGFKSYAHYFYTSSQSLDSNDKLHKDLKVYCIKNNIKSLKKPDKNQRDAINSFKINYMLNFDTDKPVYLIFKTGNTAIIDTNKQFEKVFDEGGYKVFYKNK